MSSSYDNTIKWLESKGGFYHPALVRKQDSNGVYGIYTTSAIKSGEMLCRIPAECGLFFDRCQVPEAWSVKLKMLYVILNEKRKIQRGEPSEFTEIFSLVSNLEEFTSYHPYFIADVEKEELKKCSPVFNMLFEGTRKTLADDIFQLKNSCCCNYCWNIF